MPGLAGNQAPRRPRDVRERHAQDPSGISREHTGDAGNLTFGHV
ncbi:hypothetical protein USDA257_p04470 (plasmid) [Sinorhizobium fredii USDA 257]|uniref:Uncharacterized protein n=1 Tax=Sinorhizobium fredii (strain USDA 257) TaxID=1185652 RepID=I3XH06_SINF2|nr:hypothetical protein USDA257_p04470 [Sinorhizobium fredii USDA 257]